MFRKDKIVWVLEDEASSQFVYEETLGLRYELVLFSKLSELRTALNEAASRPDLLIADLRLPDGNFMTMLSEEDLDIDMPFVVVSSLDDIDALRTCFEEGALDYLTKPFARSELIVKIERHLNCEQNAPNNHIDADPVSLRIVKNDETLTQLTTRELQIFRCFQKAKGAALSRNQLYQEVWGSHKVGTKTLDVHLYNLRKKLSTVGMRIQFQAPDSFKLS